MSARRESNTVCACADNQPALNHLLERAQRLKSAHGNNYTTNLKIALLGAAKSVRLFPLPIRDEKDALQLQGVGARLATEIVQALGLSAGGGHSSSSRDQRDDGLQGGATATAAYGESSLLSRSSSVGREYRPEFGRIPWGILLALRSLNGAGNKVQVEAAVASLAGTYSHILPKEGNLGNYRENRYTAVQTLRAKGLIEGANTSGGGFALTGRGRLCAEELYATLQHRMHSFSTHQSSNAESVSVGGTICTDETDVQPERIESNSSLRHRSSTFEAVAAAATTLTSSRADVPRQASPVSAPVNMGVIDLCSPCAVSAMRRRGRSQSDDGMGDSTGSEDGGLMDTADAVSVGVGVFGAPKQGVKDGLECESRQVHTFEVDSGEIQEGGDGGGDGDGRGAFVPLRERLQFLAGQRHTGSGSGTGSVASAQQQGLNAPSEAYPAYPVANSVDGYEGERWHQSDDGFSEGAEAPHYSWEDTAGSGHDSAHDSAVINSHKTADCEPNVDMVDLTSDGDQPTSEPKAVARQGTHLSEHKSEHECIDLMDDCSDFSQCSVGASRASASEATNIDIAPYAYDSSSGSYSQQGADAVGVSGGTSSQLREGFAAAIAAPRLHQYDRFDRLHSSQETRTGTVPRRAWASVGNEVNPAQVSRIGGVGGITGATGGEGLGVGVMDMTDMTEDGSDVQVIRPPLRALTGAPGGSAGSVTAVTTGTVGAAGSTVGVGPQGTLLERLRATQQMISRQQAQMREDSGPGVGSSSSATSVAPAPAYHAPPAAATALTVAEQMNLYNKRRRVGEENNPAVLNAFREDASQPAGLRKAHTITGTNVSTANASMSRTSSMPRPTAQPTTTTTTATEKTVSPLPALPLGDTWEVTLLVDKRERGNATIQASMAARNIPCELATLSVGDFLWVARRVGSSGRAGTFDAFDEDSLSMAGAVGVAGVEAVGAAGAAVSAGNRGRGRGATTPADAAAALVRDDVFVLDCVAERKTIADLASSLCDGRYVEQKRRLRVTGVRSVLYVVEGEQIIVPSQCRAITAAHIKTCIVGINAEAGMNVLRTRSLDHTLASLQCLHRQVELRFRRCLDTPYQRFSQYQALYGKKAAATNGQLFGHTLRQVHGCSAAAAQSLMRKYCTVARFVDSLKLMGPMKAEYVLSNVVKEGTKQKLGPALAKRLVQVYIDKY